MDVPVTGLEPDYKAALDEMARFEARYFKERAGFIRDTETSIKARAIKHLELCDWKPAGIMALLGISQTTYYRLKRG